MRSGRTDRRTYGLMDQWTDRPSYIDAWTHLKIAKVKKQKLLESLQTDRRDAHHLFQVQIQVQPKSGLGLGL